MEIETNSQSIKDAHKATKEARKERDYYKGLAGMYQLTYDEDTAISQSLMILQGIYVELQSDLLQFKKKNGNNDRVERSQRRLNLLHEQYSIISGIQTSNIILKDKLRQLERDNHIQWVEICELKNRLNPTSELI